MVDVFIGKLAYAYLEVVETYGNTLLPKEKKNWSNLGKKMASPMINGRIFSYW